MARPSSLTAERREAVERALAAGAPLTVAAAAGEVSPRTPVIRLHDLRHTHVTLLRKMGVPVEVVSKRVGHASPSITSDIYSHVAEDPALQREAAERVAALLRPG